MLGRLRRHFQAQGVTGLPEPLTSVTNPSRIGMASRRSSPRLRLSDDSHAGRQGPAAGAPRYAARLCRPTYVSWSSSAATIRREGFADLAATACVHGRIHSPATTCCGRSLRRLPTTAGFLALYRERRTPKVHGLVKEARPMSRRSTASPSR